MGQQWPAAGPGTLNTIDLGAAGISPFEGGHHYPYLGVMRPNYREGIQPHPSIENWIKDLLSKALPIRPRPRLPYSQSLPSRSFHKPLIHHRADRMKITITENKPN